MSSDYPETLRYTKEHEWASINGAVVRVGITLFAVEQLGDVTQVDLPEVGDTISEGDVFGTVESVKAVSDLYAPVNGKVTAVNGALEDAPELVNDDAHGEGWMIEIEMADPAEADKLLSAADYIKLVEDS